MIRASLIGFVIWLLNIACTFADADEWSRRYFSDLVVTTRTKLTTNTAWSGRRLVHQFENRVRMALKPGQWTQLYRQLSIQGDAHIAPDFSRINLVETKIEFTKYFDQDVRGKYLVLRDPNGNLVPFDPASVSTDGCGPVVQEYGQPITFNYQCRLTVMSYRQYQEFPMSAETNQYLANGQYGLQLEDSYFPISSHKAVSFKQEVGLYR